MDDRIRAERRRRYRRWAIALLVASALTWTPVQVRAAEHPSPSPLPAVPGQALVRFTPGTAGVIRHAVHASLGARVLRHIPAIGYDVVSVALPMEQALAIYHAHPTVEVAEPNVTGSIASLSPSDACHAEPCDGIGGQWHHLMTNTPYGWKVFPGAAPASPSPVTIAVLDTKIDASHPDWVNADGSNQLDLTHARDWVPANLQNGAARYHGTFVAGLAAAATGNGIDVAGVGYVASVLPLTVVDGSGGTDAAALADAIVYAWQRGARVINLSLGLHGPSEAVRDAIRLVRADALVVAAAGNNTGDAPFYPGSYPEAMSVAGTDAADRPAPCSNHNDNVSVAAPADRLIGLQHLPGRLIQAPCGTSAAAPQVSGLAALLFAQNPSRTPAQVRRIIERSADDLGEPGRDDRFGHGRINLARALSGAGASTTGARASVLPATGGTTTITARVTSDRPIRRAQVIIGQPGATRVAMQAADGAFDQTTEELRATVHVPASLGAGPHPIWVRANDGTGWGPTTVGVLVLDGTPPSIWGEHVANAVRATASPLQISFAIGDDHATTFSHGIEVRSTLTNTIVFRDVRYGTKGGTQTYTWLPGLDVLGGHYTVKIAAADEVGNIATKELGALVT